MVIEKAARACQNVRAEALWAMRGKELIKRIIWTKRYLSFPTRTEYLATLKCVLFQRYWQFLALALFTIFTGNRQVLIYTTTKRKAYPFSISDTKSFRWVLKTYIFAKVLSVCSIFFVPPKLWPSTMHRKFIPNFADVSHVSPKGVMFVSLSGIVPCNLQLVRFIFASSPPLRKSWICRCFTLYWNLREFGWE